MEYRKQALVEAQALIEVKLGAFDETDLRLLLQIYNRDLVDRRRVDNRFMAGLAGQNANALVRNLASFNVLMPQLWAADDDWIAEHVGGPRDGGMILGGGWLFLSMVLHTRDPLRRFPMTKTMGEGLAVLDMQPISRCRSGLDYLHYCKRVWTILHQTGLSRFGVDALLYAIYRGRCSSGGEDATVDDDRMPETQGRSVGLPVQSVRADSFRALNAEIHQAGPYIGSVVGSEPGVSRNLPGAIDGVLTRIFFPPMGKPDQPQSGSQPQNRGPVGWLHLTDLHQGMGGTNWLWPNVAAKVYDDLARLHESSGPWDLAFFTGDLTQSGSAEEFKRLDETLDRLWLHLERLGSRPRLVAVPGNHDLQWLDPVEPVALALMQWHDNRKLQERVVADADNPYLERLRQAFANFSNWSERAARWFAGEAVVRGLMPGDMSLSLSLHGIELGIVGLNSAFLQLTGANVQERLSLHPQQLHAVCGHYAPEWLQRHHVNLLLTHHPPEWLEPRARQEFRNEIDVAGRFAAHFFGHMHEGTATSIAMGGSQARHTIQGASLFGLEEYETREGRKTQRIHGYSAGRIEAVVGDGNAIERVRMRMFPRRMFDTAGGRRIDRDVSAYELDERGSLSYEVPVKRRG